MYKRILLPLDRSVIAEQALPHAAAQAKNFGAELILLRVLEPLTNVKGLSETDLEQMREFVQRGAREYLAGLIARPELQAISVRTAIVEGHPRSAILEYAEGHQVDMIVICTRGLSGFSRWLMGSIADRVVRGAKLPVLLVRAARQATGS